MIRGLLILALALLCLAGLSDLIWKATLWLCHRREGRRATLVLLLPQAGDEIEPALRCALFEAQTMGDRRCSGLLAVDTGLSAEDRATAEVFCRNRDGVLLCSPAQLPGHLAHLQGDKPS